MNNDIQPGRPDTEASEHSTTSVFRLEYTLHRVWRQYILPKGKFLPCHTAYLSETQISLNFTQLSRYSNQGMGCRMRVFRFRQWEISFSETSIPSLGLFLHTFPRVLEVLYWGVKQTVREDNHPQRSSVKTNAAITLVPLCLYRGADKSLARPGRKQINVSVRMESISFGALPCRKKKNLMTASVSMLMKESASLTSFRACFLPGRAKDFSASSTFSCIWNSPIQLSYQWPAIRSRRIRTDKNGDVGNIEIVVVVDFRNK